MSLKIIKAGILDTIQDSGRYGWRHLGINPSGAMDRFSARLSNVLLGKSPDTPVIEMHFPAAVLLFQKATIACLCGADFSATLNNQVIPLHQPFLVPANSTLQFNRLINGARCYLSLWHELHVNVWLQSASTNLKAAAGGWQGRRLIKGDCLPFRDRHTPALPESKNLIILPWKAYALQIDKYLDCIHGREWDWLSPQAKWAFENTHFHITHLSDRMGYRLSGEALVTEKGGDMISSAVDFGTIQMLPGGQLIILMADHQTTGGYPRLAHVTSASLPSLAQAKPNDAICFRFTSLQQAEDDLVQQQKYLEQLQNACKLKIENFLHADM